MWRPYHGNWWFLNQLFTRYYEKSYPVDNPPGTVSSSAGARFIQQSQATSDRKHIGHNGTFVVTKRVAPVVTIYNHRGNGLPNFLSVYNAASDEPITSSNLSSSTTTIGGYVITANTADTTWGFQFTADAEL